MSGGRFRYLCYAVGDAGELADRRTELEAMAKALEAMDDGKAAARATRDVLRALRTVEMLAEPLEKVWQAVEWEQSGDGWHGQEREALAAFNTGRGSGGS